MREKYKNNIDSFCATLDKTSPSDFDGHTDFEKLTPEQKLLWLSESSKFFFDINFK